MRWLLSPLIWGYFAFCKFGEDKFDEPISTVEPALYTTLLMWPTQSCGQCALARKKKCCDHIFNPISGCFNRVAMYWLWGHNSLKEYVIFTETKGRGAWQNQAFSYPQLISVHEQLSKLTGETVIVTNKTKKKPEKKPPVKKESKQAAPPQPKSQPKPKTSKAQAAHAQPKAEKSAKKQSASKRSANSK